MYGAPAFRARDALSAPTPAVEAAAGRLVAGAAGVTSCSDALSEELEQRADLAVMAERTGVWPEGPVGPQGEKTWHLGTDTTGQSWWLSAEGAWLRLAPPTGVLAWGRVLRRPEVLTFLVVYTLAITQGHTWLAIPPSAGARGFWWSILALGSVLGGLLIRQERHRLATTPWQDRTAGRWELVNAFPEEVRHAMLTQLVAWDREDGHHLPQESARIARIRTRWSALATDAPRRLQTRSAE